MGGSNLFNAAYLALTGPVDGAVTAAYAGFSVIKDERRWLTFYEDLSAASSSTRRKRENAHELAPVPCRWSPKILTRSALLLPAWQGHEWRHQVHVKVEVTIHAQNCTEFWAMII